MSVSTGNGYLQKPIALLTADEVNFSGIGYSTASLNSYIMDNATEQSFWWTMSPHCFWDNWRVSGFYIFSSGGYGGANYVTSGSAVRPAVSLKPDVMFSGGNGSKSNPYIVE